MFTLLTVIVVVDIGVVNVTTTVFSTVLTVSVLTTGLNRLPSPGLQLGIFNTLLGGSVTREVLSRLEPLEALRGRFFFLTEEERSFLPTPVGRTSLSGRRMGGVASAAAVAIVDHVIQRAKQLPVHSRIHKFGLAECNLTLTLQKSLNLLKKFWSEMLIWTLYLEWL